MNQAQKALRTESNEFQVEFQVGPFEAWDEAVQEKIVTRYRDINVDYEWWDCDNLMWPSSKFLNEELSDEQRATFSKAMEGISVLFKYRSIYFDLDRSWYLQFNDLDTTSNEAFLSLLGIPKDLQCYVDYRFIEGFGRHSSTTVDVEFYEYEWEEEHPGTPCPDFTKIADNAVCIFDSLVEETLYSLRDWYESLLSDECVIETLIANDYEFTEDGRIY